MTDEIWDSWEDFADCVDIDKHVEDGFTMNGKEKPQAIKEKKKTEKQNLATDQNNTFTPGPIRILQRPVVVHEEDQHRTAYVPQLKILKRPEKSLQRQREEEERKRQMAQNPVKTFAQREAAYAEARQRIMGENGVQQETNPNAKQPKGNQDNRPESLRRYSKQSKSHQQNGHGADVKRQPKGPHGGKGFKSNR